MAERNVDVVTSWAAALRRGDLAEQLWDPDLEIVNAEDWLVDATYRGHDGLRAWWKDLADAFQELRLEFDEIDAVDEQRVLTAQRFVGRFRFTEIPVDAPWASVITVREGLITHAIGYLSKERARRALADA